MRTSSLAVLYTVPVGAGLRGRDREPYLAMGLELGVETQGKG